jgi:hypothetical protein
VLQGELYVGFVSTANQLFATTLNAGDVFVFPKALVQGGGGGPLSSEQLEPGGAAGGARFSGSSPPVSDRRGAGEGVRPQPEGRPAHPQQLQGLKPVMKWRRPPAVHELSCLTNSL